MLEDLKFDEKGLIPVIAQDWRTGEVRMLAWANKEAIEKTLRTGYAHYYSRSRREVWKKGESSGELQRVLEVRLDCDEDTLIYIVAQEKNRACHTGERNCFFRDIEKNKVKKVLPFEALQRLQEVIIQRLEEKPENSYTVRIASQGEDRVLQKFGEEAIEALLALKKGDPKDIKAEVSDLLYFLVLSLTLKGIGIEEVLEELASRMK